MRMDIIAGFGVDIKEVLWALWKFGAQRGILGGSEIMVMTTGKGGMRGG